MRAHFLTGLIRVARNPVHRKANAHAGLTGLTGLTGFSAHVCVCVLFFIHVTARLFKTLSHARLTLLTLLTLIKANNHKAFRCTGLVLNPVNPLLSEVMF